MTHLNLAEGARGVLRGRCVKWSEPGFTVEGVATFINLERGVLAVAGKPVGLVQIYDPAVPNQSEGGHGPYRRISLEKKALLSEVERCVRSGLQPGWHLQLTYEKDVPNKTPGKHPWKSFLSQLAPPTLTEEQIAWLIKDGERRTKDNGTGSRRSGTAGVAGGCRGGSGDRRGELIRLGRRSARCLISLRVVLSDGVRGRFRPLFSVSVGRLRGEGVGNGLFLEVAGRVGAGLSVPGTGFTFGRVIVARAGGYLSGSRRSATAGGGGV